MNPIIIALDQPTPDLALQFVEQLKPRDCILKVGSALFTVGGPDLICAFVKHHYKVFLDLKFHDIPNTVAAACRSAAQLGVWMVNIHTSGGTRMMNAAREALEGFGTGRPLLVGVTVLTSMDVESFQETASQNSITEQVLHLSQLAYASGLDGVVCSAQEALMIKKATNPSFLTVTPGIRLREGEAHDQQRIMTPKAAIQNGADYLVVGRPITHATDPLAVLCSIAADIE